MKDGEENNQPIEFASRLKERQDLQAQPTRALVQRMWGILTESQRDILWDAMTEVETIELVNNLPAVPEDEQRLLMAKANRLFIRTLPSEKPDVAPPDSEEDK